MKKDLKEKARKLRKSGRSFREISEDLGISKSTASLWARNEKMTKQGRIRFHNLLELSKVKSRNVIFQKKKECLEKLEKDCTVLKNKYKYNRDEIKVFLALLYWGEGSKTRRRFSFINSDPEMISVYLSLLRLSFNIKEEKLSAWLHLHDYHDREKMIKFWSKITGIDKKRINIYNKKNSGIRKKNGYKGCINIRYGDYKLFDETMLIIERFIRQFKT